MAIPFKAFTVAYNGKSSVLTSKAKVGIAFDPHENPSGPPLQEFDAIWDTGATGSVISANIINKCGLQPIGMVNVNTAGGVHASSVYLVCILLPNEVGFPAVPVTEGSIAGADLLIGMDIIGSGDFAVTNLDGKTTFSFRSPSVAKINFVEEGLKLLKAGIGRNSPCPCGSGKKYKKCHGQNV